MRDTSNTTLQVRPDMVAHVVSDREVAMLGERSEYVLEGEAIAAIVPFLDGTKTEDEIVEAVADTVEPADAYFALSKLKDRDYVRSSITGWAENWSGFSSKLARHLSAGSHASPIFLTRGLEQATAETINSSLLELKDRLVQPVRIMAVDDYLRPELSNEIESAQTSGEILLPMRVAGPIVWFGPVVYPNKAIDWGLFVKRHSAIRTTDLAVLATTDAFPLRPRKTPSAVAQTAAGLASSFAVRLSAGEVIEKITNSIWEMDLRTLEADDHYLPCAKHDVGPKPTQSGHEPIVLKNSKKVFREEGGHRVCSPSETLSRLSPQVDPICGVVPVLVRGAAEDDLFHYAAKQTQLGNGMHHSDNRLLGRPQGAEGKGQTDTQAKVSCLGEAIERYSCCITNDVQTRFASFSELGAAAIHPNSVQLFSEKQFSRREEINESSGLFNSIPERFDPKINVAWSGLWSLTNGNSRWLPTALCYYNYDASEGGAGPLFAACNSNGCASGNTLEEAILQGLFELVERDAVAMWWYNRVRRASVDLEQFDDAFFKSALVMCSNRNRTLQVIDLTNDLGIPVFVAISARKKGKGFVCLGFGCHLEPRLAISRAITEMFQMLSRDEDFDDVQNMTDDPEFIEWFQNVTLESATYLVGYPLRTVGPDTYVDQSTTDVGKDVQLCVDKLAARGLETLVLNHTRPDVGFPTARVVVPGLRHFWTRFAPGRLFSVPVEMGWHSEALSEDELNPRKFIW